jgi:hypothetical protein
LRCFNQRFLVRALFLSSVSWGFQLGLQQQLGSRRQEALALLVGLQQQQRSKYWRQQELTFLSVDGATGKCTVETTEHLTNVPVYLNWHLHIHT